MHSTNSLTALIAKIAGLQKADQPQLVDLVIPKPKGDLYSLQQKMGLEDDPVKYDEIRVCCRQPFYHCLHLPQIQTAWKKLIRVAAFEDGATFANQPKEKIVKFAKKVRASRSPLRKSTLMLINSRGIKARVMIPFLRRFKADWATEAYLRRSLRNRKGHLKRRADKRKAARIDIDITLDDDRGLEDGEEGSSDETGDD